MTRKRVLLVDDDDSTRLVLGDALELLGCEVVRAEDGADVEELARTQHFDLIVLDLYMPGMNGFEVLRRLRRPDPGFLPAPATACEVGVLVVSGEGDHASIANAMSVGADEYLTKPVDLADLQSAARRLLASPSARHRVS